MALYNWLNIYGGDFKEIERQATKEDLIGDIMEDTGDKAPLDGLITNDKLRDKITKFMWECYI